MTGAGGIFKGGAGRVAQAGPWRRLASGPRAQRLGQGEARAAPAPEARAGNLQSRLQRRANFIMGHFDAAAARPATSPAYKGAARPLVARAARLWPELAVAAAAAAAAAAASATIIAAERRGGRAGKSAELRNPAGRSPELSSKLEARKARSSSANPEPG